MDPVAQRNIDDWVLQERGVVDDWSHHHLIFSNPGTAEEAIKNGTFERWIKVVNEPRYTMQQIKRSGGVKVFEDADVSASGAPGGEVSKSGVIRRGPGALGPKANLNKDWNVAIGGAAAAVTGTVGTNNATGTSTVTVDGVTLTASAPSTASATGTFTGPPGAGQSVTITNGSNALSLVTNATMATAIGSVSAAPTSTVAPTITVTNSAGSTANTLSLTTNATAATATGTFSGAGPSNGQTVTIGNGSTALTLTLSSSAATPGTGTMTVANSNGAANGDTVTIGSVVYTFEESQSSFAGQQFTGSQYYCQNTTSPCVWWGTTATNQAQALYAALTNDPTQCPTTAEGLYGNWQSTCYSYVTAPNPGVSATYTYPAAAISLINTSGSSAPFTTTSSQSAFTLASTAGSPGTIPGISGSGACTSQSAGSFNFAAGTTPATFAAYLAAAINSCDISYPAVGATATAHAGVVTITGTTLGSSEAFTLGGNASNFGWSGLTAGSNGSNGCSSATTGTFATGTTTAIVASNIAAAINSCNSSYPAVGVTANYTSGNSTFTVATPAAGPFLTESGANLAGLFSWGSVVAGTAGTNSCTSSTSGTFAASNSTTTLATNLAAAIAACPAAAGVTATSSGAVVTVNALNAGSSGDGIALGNTLSNFTLSGSSLSGGSDGVTSATTFSYWSGAAAVSTSQLAANIAAAINANSTLQIVSTGVAAAANGAAVAVAARTVGTGGNSYITAVANFGGFTWSSANFSGGAAGATVEPNMYPAKYSFSSTVASCSDFVVFPTGTAGATGSASIVAFDNLYAGTGACIAAGASAPVYWAYNTGGMATTSSVLSQDGSQVAFVQVSGTTASLVLLKWAASSGVPTLPVTLTTQSAAAYRNCTAPCMLTMALSGTHNDTFSAPFYDYTGDVLYVGDDSGNLHKVTGVFNGTPSEAPSPWPVALSSNKLTSPVYESNSGNVFVGDMGSVLHSVTAASGTVVGTSSTLGDVIADAPLVDGSGQILFAFVTTSSTHNAIYEFSTGFTAASLGVQNVGTGAAGYYLYAGTFDNVYYQSSTPTGNLYVVGNTGATTGAKLYRIPINSGTMATPVAAVSGLSFTGSGATRPWPSPVTEFCNNGTSGCNASGGHTTAGTDYVFFSVNRGAAAGCTTAAGNGCILSYNVSNPAAISEAGSGLNVSTPGTNGCWATGGIEVDNSVPTSTMAGASQIYFTGLVGNAAGGPTGATTTSSNCTAGTAGTIGATQAAQANP